MKHWSSSIGENLTRVKERITAAAVRAGRNPDDIQLVTVTKGFSVSRIVEAVVAGADELGENRAREAADKFDVLGREVEGHAISWHIIGTLQTNKVRYVIEFADLIHSLDRISLAEEINKRAGAIGKVQSVLIEVNVTGEKTKSGLSPGEASNFIDAVHDLPKISVAGLMTMAPRVESPDEARPAFVALRELLESLKDESTRPAFKHLSMGMSEDFETAIEEGATIVRVGRAIMGDRPL